MVYARRHDAPVQGRPVLTRRGYKVVTAARHRPENGVTTTARRGAVVSEAATWYQRGAGPSYGIEGIASGHGAGEYAGRITRNAGELDVGLGPGPLEVGIGPQARRLRRRRSRGRGAPHAGGDGNHDEAVGVHDGAIFNAIDSLVTNENGGYSPSEPDEQGLQHLPKVCRPGSGWQVTGRRPALPETSRPMEGSWSSGSRSNGNGEKG